MPEMLDLASTLGILQIESARAGEPEATDWSAAEAEHVEDQGETAKPFAALQCPAQKWAEVGSSSAGGLPELALWGGGPGGAIGRVPFSPSSLYHPATVL